MHWLLSGFRTYRPLYFFFLGGLGILSTSRVVLFVLFAERVTAVQQWPSLLLAGIRADTIMMGYLTLLPLLLMPFFQLPALQRFGKVFLQIWTVLWLLMLVFIEASTPAFIAQYDVRPNRLFVEYLLYPQEVISTLWLGFRGWVIATLVVAVAAAWGLRILVQRPWFHARRSALWPTLAVWPLLLLCCLLAIRSTLAHRPANPSFFALSGDPLVNSLTISSPYSVSYALYNLRHEAAASEVYGALNADQLSAFIPTIDYFQGTEFPSAEYPSVHWQQASAERKHPLNIVVILEESMGYGFVERGLTPNLQQWATKGWWFEQLYATGTRSVRGIEAVVSGFLPTPARSTVKLSLSQRNFFTMASMLAAQGYHTEFIYGGESHFDNMRSFFTGNGVQSIIDENDYDNPNFVSSWGVSDADLFDKAHQRLSQLHATDQAFFTLIFTSSNHEPFELPENALNDGLQHLAQNVDNAVRYADHALGQFLSQAQQSNYWQDTLFLVVADHDNRVYGDALVPVDKFHIPGLILGADLTPNTLTEIASQIDLAPTLLSLAGVSGYLPTLGQDLSSDLPPANRAFLQFNQTFAYLQGDDDNTSAQVTLLRPQQATLTGLYHQPSKQLSALQPADETQHQQALHWALLPSWLYREQRYQVPEALLRFTQNQQQIPVAEVASSK
ncbi:sulfatase [Pseudidiomarina sediminum]|uniref:Sulfatase n=1 Tax=Pseudidiomarina sediminum TaxID=431675 RepID=A0A432ZA78_9GAMM|nr:LTA synthase family protein [Pseudidiomarina sediminum]RUO74800.1 sulfatase [Pseudidiomarina sediminum]